MQKFKDRARSVDRYIVDGLGLNSTGRSRGVSQEPTLRATVWNQQNRTIVQIGQDDERSKGSTVTSRIGVNPNHSEKHIPTTGAHAPKISTSAAAKRRPRSPSINQRIQDGFQSVASYIQGLNRTRGRRTFSEKFLWIAVRRNEIKLVRDVLAELNHQGPFDINSPNIFGWNIVDEAVMLGHGAIAKELFLAGAKESTPLNSSRTVRLDLLTKAIRNVESTRLMEHYSQNGLEFDHNHVPESGSADRNTPSITDLYKMIDNVEHARVPRKAIAAARALVWSEDRVALQIRSNHGDSDIITRFKVDWSLDTRFSSFNTVIFRDQIDPPYLIVDSLLPGEPYHFRISVANLAGFGPFVYVQPSPVVIDSWRDITGHSVRYSDDVRTQLEGILKETEALEAFVKYRMVRNGTQPRTLQRKSSLKEGIKSILKVQKQFYTGRSVEQGVVLAIFLTWRSSVLMTTDGSLPAFMVQDSASFSVSPKDLLWLRKLSTCWSIVKPLRDLLRSSKNAASSFRFNLLQALLGLQGFLAMEDLGNVYPTPIMNQESGLTTIVLVKRNDGHPTHNHAFRWCRLNEIEQLASRGHNKLLGIIAKEGFKEFMDYPEMLSTPLPSGLYVGYAHSTFELDQVALSTPKDDYSMLPCVKISNVPHASKSQWSDVISKNSRSSRLADQIAVAWDDLRKEYQIQVSDGTLSIYDEVVQIGKDISLIILFDDKHELGSGGAADQGELVNLAVQTFEAVHFVAHRQDAWLLYCQAALILEALAVHLVQLQREAMPALPENFEIKTAQSQTYQLKERLDKLWNSSRWLPDLMRVITSRTVKRIPLFPKEPVLFAGTAPNSSTPPEEKKRQDEHSIEGKEATVNVRQSRFHSGDHYDGREHDKRATLSGPYKLSIPISVPVSNDSTARNVLSSVLMKNLSPTIVPKVVHSYGLSVRNGESVTVLPDHMKVKELLKAMPSNSVTVIRPRGDM